VFCVALSFLLAGCGATEDDGPIPVYDARGRYYQTNILTGSVQISDTCVTVRRDGDDILFLFPSDEVAWDPETATMTYLGKPYQDGDSIMLPAIVYFGRYSGTVPEGCPFLKRVYVLEDGLR